MIVQVIIFQIQEVLNWGFAGAVAMLLFVSVLIIFFLYDRLLGLSTLSGNAEAGGGPARGNPIGRAGQYLGNLFITFMAGLCERAGILYGPGVSTPGRPAAPVERARHDVGERASGDLISGVAGPLHRSGLVHRRGLSRLAAEGIFVQVV